MPKTADNYQTSITGRFPPLASSANLTAEAPENIPTQSLLKRKPEKTDNAELLRELNRAKVAFQLRAIKAVLGEVG